MFRFLLIITLILFNSIAIASSFSGNVVKISIINNHRTSSKKICSNLFSKVSSPYSINLINKEIRRLMTVKQFDDIIVFAQQTSNGVALIYKIEEAPEVKRITIDDKNSAIKISEKDFKTKVNSPFNSFKWNQDLANLELFCFENYYYDVKITDEVLISKKINSVSILVKIISGKQEFVEAIKISGNKSVDSSTIKKLLHFRPKSWWIWNKEKGKFYPSKFPHDLNKVQTLYKNKGFLDAIASISKSRGSNPNGVVLEVNIKEGPRYAIDKFLWQQDFLTSNNFSKLKSAFIIPKNSAYNPFVKDKIKERIQNLFREIKLPQPKIKIREFTSQKSSPDNPILEIGITLTPREKSDL